MITIEKSIVIDAPVEQVFAYLVDPARQPEYVPGTDEMKDIRRLPDGRYTYTIVIKILGLHADVEAEQIEVVPNERIVEKGHSSLMDYIATECLVRLADQKTRVSVFSETTFHGGPLANLGATFFAKYLDKGEEMGMEAAKVHIEAAVLATTPK